MIARLPLIRCRISASFSSSGLDASITYRIRSALSAYSFARSTPIFSTTSSVSRIPAVSIIFKEMPFRFRCSSSTSLVVPAISVTIARSSPRSTFNREDFPAFGFPRMTVRTPSFIILPSSQLSSNLFIASMISSTTFFSVSP